MKQLLTTFLILVSWMASAQIQLASSASSSSDEATVKQTISDETQAFMTRNQSQWENFWVHAPYISWSSERTPSQLLGWEAIKQAFGYNFVAGQAPRAGIAFQRDQYQVNVLENLATATFIQTTKAADGRALGKSKEVRVLEKQDNTWKLIYVYSRTLQ